MNPEALARALGALGPDCTVERRGGLAVVVASDPVAFADAGFRERAIAIATSYGATHLALELVDDAGTATSLPRD